MPTELDGDLAGDIAALRALKFDDDARTIAQMKADDAYDEGVIVRVTPHSRGGDWTVQVKQSGWEGTISLTVPNLTGRPDPRVGQTIRIYGGGVGSFHGIDLGGQEVFWRTPWERFAERVRWLAQHDRDKREAFERERATLDRRVAELPLPLKARIERFRREDPKFRMDSEAYEMAAVGDAPKIARAIATERGWKLAEDLAAPGVHEDEVRAAVEDFRAASYEEQKRRVPDLDEGHSGNTFSAAVMLAYRLLAGLDV
jgi:hypothetical protein